MRLYVTEKKLTAMFFIARKRSLGQGNIFTSACHSVHKGGLHAGEGVCMQGRGSASRGVGQTPPSTMGYGQETGGTHPTGMHSC